MSKHGAPSRLSDQIRAEATEWLVRFSEGEARVRAREDFHRWLRTSPEHVRAYLRISAFWQEAGRIGGRDAPGNIDALVRLAQSEAAVLPLEPLRAPAQHPAMQAAGPRRIAWWPALAACAGLLLLAVSAMLWRGVSPTPIFSTGTGEQRTVNLPDGSTVLINSRSTIELQFTDGERAIELRDGQAFFKVAKDATRPFVVRSGTASVRAVGTQFDVYRRDTGVVVTVVEGKVAVEQAASFSNPRPARETGSADGERSGPQLLVSAGEQALLTPKAARKRSVSRPDAATAWTQGLLIFEGAPLGEVVREFNRQNAKPLVIADAELSRLEISGTFPANGATRIVRFLEERFHVTTDETDDEIRISIP